MLLKHTCLQQFIKMHYIKLDIDFGTAKMQCHIHASGTNDKYSQEKQVPCHI